MSKDEALALFERLYTFFSQIPHTYTELKLYVNIERGEQTGNDECAIVIGDYVIENAKQWEEHKREFFPSIVEVQA
jgi:hypothetical protein